MIAKENMRKFMIAKFIAYYSIEETNHYVYEQSVQSIMCLS